MPSVGKRARFGMAAAWRGDTETVGTVIIVLVLVIVASLLFGIVGRFR